MVGLVFVGIFLLIGLLIIWGVVQQFLTVLLVGKTWVEAMPAMPAPGERLQLWLHQKGDLRINKAELAIECVEVYSYGAGSSRVTKRDVIYEQVLATRESFRSDGSRPLLEGELHLPADAMHSFHASSNQVVWQVKAKLDIAGRPDVEDEFPIAVRPEVVAG